MSHPQPGPEATSEAMDVRYLDANAAAAYLSLSVKAIYHRVRRRQIPFVKKGRRVFFDRRAIDTMMRRNCIDADALPVIHWGGSREPRHK